MWIVILNFCLFILLIGFMLYGFYKWSKLITEYEDGSEDLKESSAVAENKVENLVDGKYYRLPLWILFCGIAISYIIEQLQDFLGY